MRIQDIPSVSQILNRMESLASLAENPKELVSFPELVEKALTSERSKIPTAEPEIPSKLPNSSQLAIPWNPSSLKDQDLKQKNEGSKSSEILETIERIATEQGIDPKLVKAIVKAESNFKPNAVSPKGAMGLMQLMPKTAEALGVEEPFNPEDNITGGVTYLKSLFREFKDPTKAIAAYNAGPGAVRKYGAVPPYRETKEYVEKVKNYYLR
ncbi:MAG: lytic transglycosylase domain-containing protein [Leptospira sp.]|nr:lytic transglycosylase domain-containing protein [Leptospira sp.]